MSLILLTTKIIWLYGSRSTLESDSCRSHSNVFQFKNRFCTLNFINYLLPQIGECQKANNRLKAVGQRIVLKLLDCIFINFETFSTTRPVRFNRQTNSMAIGNQVGRAQYRVRAGLLFANQISIKYPFQGFDN